PSYTWSNLFCRQLQTNDPTVLTGLSQSAASASVGINSECGIPKLNTNGSLGNIANIVACGLNFFVVGAFIHFTGRRKAAVGQPADVLRLLTLPFQLTASGSLLIQGSTALVWLGLLPSRLVSSLHY
ncbi:hypothetical protein BDR03DRAFT_810960, partial [Suillus americanus]